MSALGRAGAAASGAAGSLAGRLRGGGEEQASGRWRSVTIYRTPEQVAPGGRLPEPLARLGSGVEVRVLPAPGDKGTELSARLRAPEPTGLASAWQRVRGTDPRQDVRSALREAKQLVEVGEVLRVDPAPHGRRPPTPAGAALEAVIRRSGREGVL